LLADEFHNLAVSGARIGDVEDRLLPAALSLRPTLASVLWWMATQGNKWLLRRSTDLMPSLARLAAEELRAGRRRGVTMAR
jgi:hypothetical protein